jgi:hypothetical protein
MMMRLTSKATSPWERDSTREGLGGDRGNNRQETHQGGGSRPEYRPQHLAMTTPPSRGNSTGRSGSKVMGTKPLLSVTRHWGNTIFVHLHSQRANCQWSAWPTWLGLFLECWGWRRRCRASILRLLGTTATDATQSFILPRQNAWVWTKAKYLRDTARLGTFYNNKGNKNKLWLMGASKAKLTETPLPCLLVLPTFVAEFLRKQGGACLPHKLHKFVSSHIDGGESQVPPDKWQLVLDWCLVAAQGGNDGTSILNLGSPEPALCQDLEFLKWCKLRLNTTLRQEPQQAMGQYNGGGPGNLKLVKQITQNMGQSFMAGVQALAPSIAGAAQQGGGYNKDGSGDKMGGRLYTENNVAALKGYCGVINPANIPTIWGAFQHTREIASHQTTSGCQCSNGQNRRTRTSTKHHSLPSKQSRTLLTSNLTRVKPCQPTHWHKGEFQSSRATPKQHMRSKLSRTTRRQDVRLPIPCNLMKSSAADRLHQAHCQITTLNCA